MTTARKSKAWERGYLTLTVGLCVTIHGKGFYGCCGCCYHPMPSVGGTISHMGFYPMGELEIITYLRSCVACDVRNKLALSLKLAEMSCKS